LSWQTTYLGSVNRWECDENDHLNVRFYVEKATQAVDAYLAAPGDTKGSEAPRIVSAHVRFLREARIATPITGRCATVESGPDELVIQCELVHSSRGEVLAGMVFHVRTTQLRDPAPLVPLSESARPRGLVRPEPSGLPTTFDDAIALGFRPVSAGVVCADECDENGTIMPWCYFGRISDGVPNLWSEGGDSDSSAVHGGAVLEYRLRELRPFQRGDRIAVASGIASDVTSMTGRTYRIMHLGYAREGGLALFAEVIGVTLDLETRRAVAPSAEKLRELEERRVHGFD
jgi:acyl-CoA thioester hydrolase